MFLIRWEGQNGLTLLTGVSARLANAAKVGAPGIRAIVRNAIRAQFETQGGSGNTPWPELSPRYSRWKAKNYPERKMLVRTGRMKSAFTNGLRSVVFGPKGSTTIEFESGEPIVYWKSHQYGDPRRNLPARPIIPDFNQTVFISGIGALIKSFIRRK